ncbi:head GIN domain-containing protein [Psychroflexus aestuariivivens]|uniref:head GIN domain-containing protein n=1 Tax=Psychroflexus aestuariivivens TaxID=1795040 RepID=UPI000FDC0797|nr:head GIN domain-containing protein [Psychroflexus aestuariivivens]
MKTYLSILAFLVMLTTSCNSNFNFSNQVNGTGEVLNERMDLSTFTEVKLEKGWKVKLIPSTENYIEVEANSNLLDILIVEDEGGKLLISAESNIGSADAKNIRLYFTERLNNISVSSGTGLTAESVLDFDDLELKVSSGADVEFNAKLKKMDASVSSGADLVMNVFGEEVIFDASSGSDSNLEVNVKNIDVSSSSGSNVEIIGETDNLSIDSSSGSDVEAKALKAKSVFVSVSSGSDASVYPLENLKANHSSGGHIEYYHKPSNSIDIEDSKSGGGVKYKN